MAGFGEHMVKEEIVALEKPVIEAKATPGDSKLTSVLSVLLVAVIFFAVLFRVSDNGPVPFIIGGVGLLSCIGVVIVVLTSNEETKREPQDVNDFSKDVPERK